MDGAENSQNLTDRGKRARQEAFLAAYAQTGVILTAAKATGISRETHYEWLKKDETYPERFEQAKEDSIDVLEQEAIFRATEGLRKYKFHQGEPILDENGNHYYEVERSDTLLIFMLKGKRPEKYRDNFKGEVDINLKSESTVRVLEDQNWYGNADRINASGDEVSPPAETPEASDADTAGSE